MFLTVCILLLGCQPQSNGGVDGLAKADFDIDTLDQQGLINGVALDFEFCIANQEAVINEVNALYPKLQIMASSRGRIGCDVSPTGQGAQVLVIGSTAVADYRAHFIKMSGYPSINKISRTYWE